MFANSSSKSNAVDERQASTDGGVSARGAVQDFRFGDVTFSKPPNWWLIAAVVAVAIYVLWKRRN